MTGPTVTDIARQVATLGMRHPHHEYPVSTCWNLVDPAMLAGNTDVWKAGIERTIDQLDVAGIEVTDDQPVCCIVGRACLDSGVPAELLRNDAPADDLLRARLKVPGLWVSPGPLALEFVERVQGEQDGGTPWGRSVRTAYIALEVNFSDTDLDGLFGPDLHEQLDRFAHPGKADK